MYTIQSTKYNKTNALCRVVSSEWLWVYLLISAISREPNSHLRHITRARRIGCAANEDVVISESRNISVALTLSAPILLRLYTLPCLTHYLKIFDIQALWRCALAFKTRPDAVGATTTSRTPIQRLPWRTARAPNCKTLKIVG